MIISRTLLWQILTLEYRSVALLIKSIITGKEESAYLEIVKYTRRVVIKRAYIFFLMEFDLFQD